MKNSRNNLYPISKCSFLTFVLQLSGYKMSEENTVDSRYLEFDGTMEKIRVNRSSTKEELQKYRKCSLFKTKGRQLERNFEELKPAMSRFSERF